MLFLDPVSMIWVNRYFNSLDENTSIEEVIDFLVSFKASLQAKGYEVPPLTEMCLRLRDGLIDKGIEIDDDTIERIYNEIAKRENILIKPSSFYFAINKHSKFKIFQTKKHSKKKGFEFSDGFAIGFVKSLGGALLCIIPHPITIAIGSGLVLSGVDDMIEHAGESPRKEGSIEDRMKNLPPPSDRH